MEHFNDGKTRPVSLTGELRRHPADWRIGRCVEHYATAVGPASNKLGIGPAAKLVRQYKISQHGRRALQAVLVHNVLGDLLDALRFDEEALDVVYLQVWEQHEATAV